MADNVVANAGSGGATFATDDIGGVQYPRQKLVHGADGVNAGDVALGNGLPVQPATGAAFPITDNGGSLTIDNAALSVTGGGVEASALRVTIASDSTGVLSVDDNGGSLTVDGTVSVSGTVTISGAVTNAGTFAVQVTTLPTGLATSANQTTEITGLASIDSRLAGTLTVSGTGGTFPVTDSGGSLTVDAPVGTPVFVRLSDGSAAITTLPVSLASVPSHAVTNAGTFAVQVDGAALTSLQLLDDAVSGSGFNVSQLGGVNVTMGNGGSGTGVQRVTIANDSTGILATVSTVTTVTTVSTLTGGGVAHDSADSGNPHKIGAKATASISGLTLVTDADRTNLFAGLDGVQIVRLHSNLEDIVTGVAAITDGSSTSVIAAIGAGIKIYITEVIIANSSASNVTVDLRDGTGGSVKATFSAPATGGSHKTLSTPLPFSANTAVAADPSAAASTVTVTLIGFKSKV